ncbi:hypothetical protein L4D00_05975 [Photobacterium swingsii]|uniref:KfrA N-terminal DNA-binding domain-containing protein n=1 Tax=Photobacterium swingsii TaxID=680026 RepID=A0A0J8V7Q7_9GAMM|nr:hypothetical protein [Photobacterium swingsii]KMV29488.1 hypothetical protein AB733_17420 [Photobacterium swingsii]PSW20933.1 hypothetical protein C9I94_21935 [Photobacterium swingsii]
MSEISQDLEQAIHSLVTEGKEPSVALIKSRLTSPLPMPLIIKALQAWKKNAKVPKIEKTTPSLTAEQRITQLEQQVAALSARLAKLESQN